MKLPVAILLLTSALALPGCATPSGGANAVRPAQGPVEIQLIALNDFHGNLETPVAPTSFSRDGEMEREVLGGAARLGATLEVLRTGQEHTLTVAAGDLIGASPFVSANFLDEPAIMALNLAGLDIASVGNHEFDRGIPELRRMQDGGCEQLTSRTPCALEPFSGAGFAYLAGNVVDGEGRSVFPATALRQTGPVTLGFIGLTLRDTGMLVSPSATQGYAFLDEVDTANRLARDLREQGADAVILLIHEGGRVDPGQNLADCPNLAGAIVPIVERLDPAISVVVSGHTHMSYVCHIAMAGGGTRLLTSAGRYGAFVTDIRLSVDPTSGSVNVLHAANVPVTGGAGEQQDIARLVQRYAMAAAPIAARVVGRIAPASPGTGDCPDTPAADLVADAQLDAARRALGTDAVDLAFINTGGVRTDLAGAADGVMTYGEIFALQPFGNVLQILEMSGDDIAAVLEEQFCGDGLAEACFSLLIPSSNFAYTYDRSRPAGHRVTQILLDGSPLDRGRLYRVSFNNFLVSGGDGFASLVRHRTVGEAGSDLDALEAWLARGARIPTCGRLRDVTAGL